jgi:hypothetical protein
MGGVAIRASNGGIAALPMAISILVSSLGTDGGLTIKHKALQTIKKKNFWRT